MFYLYCLLYKHRFIYTICIGFDLFYIYYLNYIFIHTHTHTRTYYMCMCISCLFKYKDETEFT